MKFLPKVYLVKPGTESYRTIVSMVRKVIDARQARIDFVLREIPSIKDPKLLRISWATGSQWGINISSFGNIGNIGIPRNWKIMYGTNIVMPTTKTKYGRALRTEMFKSIYTVPDQFDFSVALGIVNSKSRACSFDFEEVTNRDFVVFLNHEHDKITIPRDFTRISDIEYENLHKRIRNHSNKLSLRKVLCCQID